MGIISSSLTHYVMDHPELRPAPAIEVEPLSAIDRFTSGLITWARLVEECLESERDEASCESMTERERQHKIDELDTLIAFLREELGCFAARNRDTEGVRFRSRSIVRLAARRHILALAS